VTLGDQGEEAVFSRPIGLPRTTQVFRRWLRYVASREGTIFDRLLDRVQNQDRFKDSYAAAHLFAGIGATREVTSAIYSLFKSDFENDRPTTTTFQDYDPVSTRFLA